jgi:hypothetical protein
MKDNDSRTLLGLFSKTKLKRKWVLLACATAAVVTYILNDYFITAFYFDVGFMNIFMNSVLTILFLLLIKRKR